MLIIYYKKYCEKVVIKLITFLFKNKFPNLSKQLHLLQPLLNYKYNAMIKLTNQIALYQVNKSLVHLPVKLIHLPGMDDSMILYCIR